MKLTKDDERARRICSLALEFMNAGAPIPSSSIGRAFYPTLSPDSFRRAFSRDREALAACGVIVRELPQPSAESLWQIDEEQLAGGLELEPLEAAALDVACAPLLDDEGFPLAEELRLALAKLTRAFAEASTVPVPGRREGKVFSTLRSCLMDRLVVHASYTDARGTSSERDIAPYALFELRGVRYLVAGRVDKGGRTLDGGTRTYRVERFDSAREVPGSSFDVPQDFSVEDWRKLPFQIGGPAWTATFEVPRDRVEALRREAGGRGRLTERGEGVEWSVDANDVDAAASWAVAQGIRPVSPDALVASWQKVLEGVLADAS